MSTFAQEIAAANAGATEAPAQQAQTEASQAPPADPMNNGLPIPQYLGGEITEQQTVSENAAEVATPAPNPAAKIRIGSQEFTSYDDAMKYAQDLELTVLQTDAYNQGKEAATPKASEPPVPTIEDTIQDELFTNPKEALQKYKQHILETVKADIQKEAKRDADVKAVWNDFYSQNADLANHAEVVQYVVQKNWNEIANIPLPKAAAIVAERSRQMLSGYKQAALPSKEMPTKPAVVAGVSGSPSSGPAAKPQTALDFVTQLNKLRKRELNKST